MSELIDVKKAAEIIGVKEARVRALARKDRIPHGMFAGAYQFKQADVEAFARIPRTVGNPGKKGRTPFKFDLDDSLGTEILAYCEKWGDTFAEFFATAARQRLDGPRNPKKK